MADTIDILKELALQVRYATQENENTAERVGRTLVGILNLLSKYSPEELEKIFLRKDRADGTNFLLKFGEFIDSMVAGKGAGIFPDAARSLNALKSAIPLLSLNLSSTVSLPWRATIPSPSPVPSKVYRSLKTAHTA